MQMTLRACNKALTIHYNQNLTVLKGPGIKPTISGTTVLDVTQLKWNRLASAKVYWFPSHVRYPDSVSISGLYWSLTACIYVYHRLGHWFTPGDVVLGDQGSVRIDVKYLFHWDDLDGLFLTRHALATRHPRLKSNGQIYKSVAQSYN